MIIQKVVKGLRFYSPRRQILDDLFINMKSQNLDNLQSLPHNVPNYIQETIVEYVRSGRKTLPSEEDFNLEAIKNYKDTIFRKGILCRWWEKIRTLPADQIPERLTEENLYWHQNKYTTPDPNTGGLPFCEETPFISTTAGTIVRKNFWRTNQLESARVTALKFATNGWSESGLLVYCYVFTLGKQSVGHQQFAEELRDFHVYTGFSPYQPEGEITAKIQIPTTQIKGVEIWIKDDYKKRIHSRYFDISKPTDYSGNSKYLPPEDYHNIRELL